MFGKKEILPFAVNVMPNLSTKNASNEALPSRPTVITAIARAPCSVVICNKIVQICQIIVKRESNAEFLSTLQQGVKREP